MNHQKFLGHLAKSNDDVWLAARWLQARGMNVTVHPLSLAPSHDQWRKYADAGDLSVSMRIEVKALSRDFTGADDWPFGDKFIVCAKHAFDAAAVKPYMFIYLNAKRSHVAVVMGRTSRHWTFETRSDGRYTGVTQEFYFCPLPLVRFSSFNPDPA